MFDTLLRTVFGDRNSSAAICEFDRPAATRLRTSCSRAVSCGNTPVAVETGAPAKNSATRLAIAGPKIASPCATAVMARTISAWLAPFNRYPRAPARIAANKVWSSSAIVSTTTPMCGLSEVILRVASMPSSSGI
jgi:hypothetical protein